MNCQIFPSQMCPGRAYKSCPLNLMNFWEIICIYYTALQGSIKGILINLPILVLSAPLLPPALFFYLSYLFVLPLGDFFKLFFPALEGLLVPIAIFFIIGLSRLNILQLFV